MDDKKSAAIGGQPDATQTQDLCNSIIAGTKEVDAVKLKGIEARLTILERKNAILEKQVRGLLLEVNGKKGVASWLQDHRNLAEQCHCPPEILREIDDILSQLNK